MKTYKKIFLLWTISLCVFGVSSLLLPHVAFKVSNVFNVFVQLLIGIISLFLVFKEPNRKNRYLFLHFAIFFLFSILQLAYNFVEEFLSSIDQYLPLFISQYVNGIYYALFAFALAYVVVDSLFRDIKVWTKYAVTIAIVGAFFGSYFYDFISEPKYAYSTRDVKDFVLVDRAYGKFVREAQREPSAEELAQQISLPAWRDDHQVGNLYPEHNLARIRELIPYLYGDNYLLLIWKPINIFIIKMNVFACFFILLFFGYQYKKDPPQGALIDKIMFLFLLFGAMEILHAWSYINAIELQDVAQIFDAGQYVTLALLLLTAAFFGARLRFICTPAGQFYEDELVHNAQHITRWRDWVDNIVVHYFLNPKTIRGTLFSRRSEG